MSTGGDHFDFDDVLNSIRRDDPEPAEVNSAAERVWSRLSAAGAPTPACNQFRAMMPAFRAGELTEAGRLLLVDHTHECVACRKALHGGPQNLAVMPPPKSWPASRRWAIAATLFIGLGAATLALLTQYGPSSASAAVIETTDGNLYAMSPSGPRTVAAGERVEGRGPLRTGKGSSAVLRLADGSRLEMRERAELGLSERGRDLTVRLDRGQIIVQAAKRTSGHLYVDARDCNVAVTGTIFSVNRGTKGSRVSVVEGAVRVTRGATETLLRPGDQVATAEAVGRVPVADEVAWSRNVDNYIALLKEFKALEKDLQTVRLPGVRYASRLLPLLPADTALVVALPNLGESISQAHRVLQDHVRTSPEMREWFEKRGNAKDLEQGIDRLRSLSEYLGDEIVVAVTAGATGKPGQPVFMAEVAKPGFQEYFDGEMSRIGEKRLRAADHLRMRGNVAMFSPEPGGAIPETGGFAGTGLYQRISDAYRDGAGFLLAADLQKLVPAKAAEDARRAGLTNLKYLVVEQRDLTSRSATRAQVTFAGPREGITSWLATPGAMGSLDFVSPEASVAVSFALKNPSVILDDIFRLASGSDRNFDRNLAEAESKLGVSLKNDLAASLGSDASFAFEGSALPVSSWKLVVEVNDPPRLQAAIERMVESAARESGKKVAIQKQAAGQRTYYVLGVPGGGPLLEAHFTYVDGYLVAAATRALLDKTIQDRANGYTLPRSPSFTSLLPRDRQANFSAVVWQNAGSLLSGVRDTLAGAALTERQRESLDKLAAESKPGVVYAYAGEDRIEVASSGGFLGLSLADLIGAGSPTKAMRVMKPNPRVR